MCAVLLMKTTSLGDVIHNLPVVEDIFRFNPQIAVDWCAELPFCEIIQLNPHVRKIIPVQMRTWRKNCLNNSTWRDFFAFKKKLQTENYTHIIDSQGLIKSALLCKMANGKRFGFARNVIKEKIACHFYDKTFEVARAQNAVVRNRQLAASVLGYSLSSNADYGLVVQGNPHWDWLPSKPYIVAFSATSRKEKMWQNEKWQQLCTQFQCFTWIFPSGNENERQNAQSIVAHCSNAILAPFLTLKEMALLIAHAKAVVGVDTGLTHLAAAFKTPAIALFLQSEPDLTGLCGAGFCQNLGGMNQNPSTKEVAKHLEKALFEKN